MTKLPFRFAAISVAPKIRRHYGEALGKHRCDLVPHHVGLRITVQHQERRPGSAKAPRDTSLKHFFAFNLTASANRVQDVLTALAFLHQRHPGKPELLGLSDAGLWSLYAAAVAPIEVTLNARLSDFAGTDAEYIDRFFVPGLRRAGGLTAANRILGRAQ